MKKKTSRKNKKDKKKLSPETQKLVKSSIPAAPQPIAKKEEISDKSISIISKLPSEKQILKQHSEKYLIKLFLLTDVSPGGVEKEVIPKLQVIILKEFVLLLQKLLTIVVT